MSADQVSLIVSILGLLAAIGTVLFSTHHQYWKRADIQVTLGDRVRSFRSSDNGRLALSLPLAFFNSGAQVGVVVSMRGTLVRLADNEEHAIRWDRIEQAVEATDGEQFRTRFGFGGYPDAVLVPPRGALPLRIQFQTPDSFAFAASDYRLTIRGYSKRRETPAFNMCVKFAMDEKTAQRWLETMGPPGKGISRGAIDIGWQACEFGK